RDFLLTVVNVNDPPTVINPIPDQTTAVTLPFTFQVPANTFIDVDLGDSIASYSSTLSDGSPLPAFLSFDPATRTFSGTPTALASYDIRVNATDTHGAVGFDVFTLRVGSLNHAPTYCNPIQPLSTPEDTAFTFVVPSNTFCDIDAGDKLTLTASSGF